MLHFETENGKGLGDTHFAVEIREVNRYCKETQRNVNSGADFVTVPGYIGGIAKKVLELIGIQ